MKKIPALTFSINHKFPGMKSPKFDFISDFEMEI